MSAPHRHRIDGLPRRPNNPTPRHLFEKDLSLFGDKDEVCPHCAAPYIKPAVTNESVLFETFWSEFDRSVCVACERETGIKTRCAGEER